MRRALERAMGLGTAQSGPPASQVGPGIGWQLLAASIRLPVPATDSLARTSPGKSSAQQRMATHVLREFSLDDSDPRVFFALVRPTCPLPPWADRFAELSSRCSRVLLSSSAQGVRRSPNAWPPPLGGWLRSDIELTCLTPNDVETYTGSEGPDQRPYRFRSFRSRWQLGKSLARRSLFLAFTPIMWKIMEKHKFGSREQNELPGSGEFSFGISRRSPERPPPGKR